MNKVKWTLSPVSGPNAVKTAQRCHGEWRVPVLQFFAAGEPTEFYLWLVFPILTEETAKHNELVSYFEGIVLEPDTYRPFPGRVVRRSLSEMLTAIATVVSYLEIWDLEVCQAYRYWRGLGKPFQVNI